MSLRRFDGWEPAQHTRVTQWTPDGQAAAWVTTTEAEWTRPQRSLMLALAYFEGGCCRRCGEHLAKSMDPMSDPDRPEATHNWVAEGPDECFACKALIRAENKLSKDKEGGQELLSYSTYVPALVPVTPRVRAGRGGN